jgi:hypothetical protein
MLFPVYANLVIALLFYLLLPALAAFANAASWRGFRRRLEDLAEAPVLGYSEAARLCADPKAATSSYRLFGSVEAMEGSDRLWVRSPSVSAVVDLSRSHLYVLGARGAEAAPDSIERAGSVERLVWRRVRSLSEGTRLYIAGRVTAESGHPLFVGAPGEPLIAVCYDHDERGLESALLAGARSRNELWGRQTFVFWTLGLAVASILLVSLGRVETLPTLRFLSVLLAFSPLVPFLPPGALFFVLGNALWRRCLRYRLERDVRGMRVPPPGLAPADAVEKRRLRRHAAYAAAGTALSTTAAFIANFLLIFALYRALG